MDKTTEKSVVKRSPNWDQEEKDILLKLVLEKIKIVENTKLDSNTNKKKKEAWHTILTLFNLSSVGTTDRTLDQIQNQWRKMKHAAKLKRVGGDDPPSPATQDEKELEAYLTTAKYFDVDYNTIESLFSTNETTPGQLETEEITIKEEFVEEVTTTQNNGEQRQRDHYDLHEANEVSAPPPKRVKHDGGGEDVESAKRIRLLELEIIQKESDIKFSKLEFDKKIKMMELQMKHMNEEHDLKMQKLKFELDVLKN